MSKRRRVFERKNQPLISRRAFAVRVSRFFLASTILVGVSLFAGILGYRHFEGMSWIDAFVNASMILSGMGPLAAPLSWGGKLFAGIYALYSGLIMILASGLLLAPLVHRLLHNFHIQPESDAKVD